MIRCWSWPKVKSQGQRSRSNMSLVGWVRIELFSPKNHEQMVGSWSKTYKGLISMRCWSWLKVKVTRSKVKVIYAILWKTCFGYISWTNHWTLMMSIHMISNNVMLKLTKGQGHKVKSQGHKVKGQIQICKCVKMLWLYSINQLSYIQSKGGNTF